MSVSIKKEYLKIITGMGLAAAILMYPDAAVAGAQQALLQWYKSVAPSLFPFMALMPLLTSRESACAYEKLAGRILGKIFGLPGAAAPVFIIGMIAGSPAGCIAARQTAARSGMERGQLKRLAFSVIGFSPAYLITGIGVSIFGNAAVGAVLLRSQVAAQIIMALILKGMWRDDKEKVLPGREEQEVRAITPAVAAILKVAGFMALFGSFSAITGEMLGENTGKFVGSLLEITTGAWAISGSALHFQYKLILLSGLCGFGGVAICVQNLAALSECGINAIEFCLCRLFAGMISMGITVLQLSVNTDLRLNMQIRPIIFASIVVIILIIPIIIRINNAFLNNSNFENRA